MKILLVDDDDDLREALSGQLVMTEDFDVFEAGNGSEAVAKAKAPPIIYSNSYGESDNGNDLTRISRINSEFAADGLRGISLFLAERSLPGRDGGFDPLHVIAKN